MKPVLYVDVDDTLVRSFGSKRVPVTHVVALIRELKGRASLYLWSRGGAEYARQTAAELELADCFEAFLPKPDLLIDDAQFGSWGLRELHPNACHGRTVDELLTSLRGAVG